NTLTHLHPSFHLAACISIVCVPYPPSSPLFPYTTLFRSFVVDLQQQLACLHLVAFLHVQGRDLANHFRAQHHFLFMAEIARGQEDRKSTRLNSSHVKISYAVFCLKKKNSVKQKVKFAPHK